MQPTERISDGPARPRRKRSATRSRCPNLRSPAPRCRRARPARENPRSWLSQIDTSRRARLAHDNLDGLIIAVCSRSRIQARPALRWGIRQSLDLVDGSSGRVASTGRIAQASRQSRAPSLCQRPPLRHGHGDQKGAREAVRTCAGRNLGRRMAASKGELLISPVVIGSHAHPGSNNRPLRYPSSKRPASAMRLGLWAGYREDEAVGAIDTVAVPPFESTDPARMSSRSAVWSLGASPRDDSSGWLGSRTPRDHDSVVGSRRIVVSGSARPRLPAARNYLSLVYVP